MIKVCRHCGREFESKKAGHYCDRPECQAAREAEFKWYQKEYKRTHKKKVTDRERQWRTKPKDTSQMKLRKCLKCGRMFKSFGPENRLCVLCRQSNQNYFYGAQDWGGGTVREVFI
jgi:hypothetical protein